MLSTFARTWCRAYTSAVLGTFGSRQRCGLCNLVRHVCQLAVCDGTGEDATCADSVHFYDFSVEDHFYCALPCVACRRGAPSAGVPDANSVDVRVGATHAHHNRPGHPDLLVRGVAPAACRCLAPSQLALAVRTCSNK